jgi:hypothetical protein
MRLEGTDEGADEGAEALHVFAGTRQSRPAAARADMPVKSFKILVFI